MRIVVIPAESDPYEKQVPEDLNAQLDALQQLVGGNVQTFLIPKFPRCVLLAREYDYPEQAKDAVPNQRAERLTGFPLLGTVIVSGQAPPDLVDIPAEVVKELARA